MHLQKIVCPLTDLLPGNVVDVLVNRLRAKVDKDHDVKLIQTIRGVGYMVP